MFVTAPDGNVTSSSGAQPNEFQFAGEQTDPTGLQYLRARYYDTVSGTFISRDPLSSGVGWGGHPFAYAGGAPTVLTDPSGLYPGIPGNEAERAWCTSFWGNIFSAGGRARQCFEVNLLGEYANNLTKALFGTNEDSGPSNAFRHCMWLGMCSFRFGPETAKAIGDRHEKLDSGVAVTAGNTARAKVDLWNNRIGIGYGSALQHGAIKSYFDALFNYKSYAKEWCLNMLGSGNLIESNNDPRINSVSWTP